MKVSKENVLLDDKLLVAFIEHILNNFKGTS